MDQPRMTWVNVSTHVALGAALGAIGVLAFMCGTPAASTGSSASTGSTAPVAQATATTLARTTDTVRIERTQYIAIGSGDTVYRDTTYFRYIHDTVVRKCPEPPKEKPQPPRVAPPRSLTALATDVLANLKPQQPIEFFEVFGRTDYDLIDGGYAAGLSLQMNLDKIHVLNAQPYIELSYERESRLRAAVGVRGKILGWW